MQWLSVIALALSPGMALLAYFYLKDRYDTEPIASVTKVFAFGMLLVFPTMVLQRALVLGFGGHPLGMAFGISAGLEEFLKWFVVYYVIYKHQVFDEPYDGIVYCTAVSLGFATLENIIYALLNTFTFSALLFRALIPVSAHALFGVVMGYYMGLSKFEPQKRRKYLIYSLAFPIIWHGLLDFILLTVKTGWIKLVIPLMLILWILGLWKVNSANAKSPFRVVKRDDEIKI